MTEQIQPLRKATLHTHKEEKKLSIEGDIILLPGEPLDIEGQPKKISENHALYEVRLKGRGLVHVVQGVDFEFV